MVLVTGRGMLRTDGASPWCIMLARSFLPACSHQQACSCWACSCHQQPSSASTSGRTRTRSMHATARHGPWRACGISAGTPCTVTSQEPATDHGHVARGCRDRVLPQHGPNLSRGLARRTSLFPAGHYGIRSRRGFHAVRVLRRLRPARQEGSSDEQQPMGDLRQRCLPAWVG
jgi:hypothetical protein